MAKGVTLTDIAERVGVSNVAVHKALTDKPGVNAELRSKIKALAKEMGYTGTASAAGRRKQGRRPAISVWSFPNSIMDSLLRSMEDYMRKS